MADGPWDELTVPSYLRRFGSSLKKAAKSKQTENGEEKSFPCIGCNLVTRDCPDLCARKPKTGNPLDHGGRSPVPGVPRYCLPPGRSRPPPVHLPDVRVVVPLIRIEL
jgi:hypothetical protein